MAAPRIVLISVDGSKHADYALEFYAKSIRKDGDKLVLVHVPQMYSLKDASPGVIQDLMMKMKDEADKMKARYEKLLSEQGIAGEVMESFGEPGEQIVAVAAKVHATLIIVGTRGLGKIRRTLMGSVSDYVMHHAHIPVLVTRPPAQSH